jgi:translation initiation factor 4E
MENSTQLEENVLNSSWCLWYHDPENNNWDIKSYKKIYSFNSIERYWTLHNTLQDGMINSGMFFLMRDGIMPMWEDGNNINGGFWSYKIPKKEAHDAWIDLSVALIAECVSSEMDTITGISISPKKAFCVIKIWNNDSKKKSEKYLAVDELSAFRNNVPRYSLFLEQK